MFSLARSVDGRSSGFVSGFEPALLRETGRPANPSLDIPVTVFPVAAATGSGQRRRNSNEHAISCCGERGNWCSGHVVAQASSGRARKVRER
eukprot:5843270-Alexandrium_andersonii.AAC.1